MADNASQCNYLIISIVELKINLGCIYKSPNANFHKFLSVMEDNVFQSKNLFIFGGMNLNALDPDDLNTNTYLEMIKCNGFVLLNKLNKLFVTRLNTSKCSGTIIDHDDNRSFKLWI